jgi:hypothetical protein
MKLPKMCVFHVAGGDPPIYINPTLVRLLRVWDPRTTIVEFDKEHRESVPLPIEQVRQALDKAMNEG